MHQGRASGVLPRSPPPDRLRLAGAPLWSPAVHEPPIVRFARFLRFSARVDWSSSDPLWGPDGRELFYLTPEAAMVVPVETGDTFQRGSPQRLFSMDPYNDRPNRSWDISPDGQRFLMIKR